MEEIKNNSENMSKGFSEKSGAENREPLVENPVAEETKAETPAEQTESVEQVASETATAVTEAPTTAEATEPVGQTESVEQVATETATAVTEAPTTAEATEPAETPQTDKRFGTDNPCDKEQAKTEALATEIKNLQITFSNGKVNQEYVQEFDIEKYKFRDTSIAEVEFLGLDAIGLQYFPEEKKIKGVPTLAGDNKITMRFHLKGYENKKRPPIERQVVFIINPDPKSLWQNNPTPTDIEYYKPDSDKAFVKAESKTLSKYPDSKKTEIVRKDMVAASQRGRSHANENPGKARDDDFALYFDENSEWYIMVVADGAGSAPFSRKGSQIACQTAIEVCKKQLTNVSDVLDLDITEYHKNSSGKGRSEIYRALHSEFVGKAAFEAYKKICEEAANKKRKPKEYATTFLLSICKKFDFGWFVGAFWVGDGGIGIYRQEPQELKVLGEADGGEFAGQTRFLTMPEIFQDRPRTRFEIVEDFTALILMTDGVTDPKFETDANLNRIEKWHELWNDLNGTNEDGIKVDFTDGSEQSAGQLLEWLNFWSKGNHDDRTIAILF
jgi:serine/threonine protein phosphatase PrpC